MEKTILIIKNMNCIHCKGRIEKAMEKAGIECVVTLEDKCVAIDSAVVEKAKEVISKAGYIIL